jgi:hypothetical protein
LKDIDVGSGPAAIVYIYKMKKTRSNRNRYFSNKKTCQLRGIKNTLVLDVLTLETKKFDTILLLMNGTGILEHLKNTPFFYKS